MADEPRTLVETIDRMTKKIANTDPAWVVFVNDHINDIRNSAIPVQITDAIRDRYQHKLEHFLRDNFCDKNISWIARIVNELTMYEDFTLKDFILIPDLGFITNLYRSYRTSINLG